MRTLVEVVLVVLVVDFATVLAEEESHPDWDALLLTIAILLLAPALRIGVADHLAGH